MKINKMAESKENGARADSPQNFPLQSLSEVKEESNMSEITKSVLSEPIKDVEEGMDCLDKETDSGNSFFKSPNTFVVPLSLSPCQNKKSKSKDGNIDVESITDNDGSVSAVDSSHKNQACVNYKEPEWGGQADDDFSFDVLKNGSIIGNIPLSGKPYYVFGRLQSCDVTLEHPSLSRYHAVIQYSKDTTPTHEKGWYVYDLDSTHGTWVNKKKVNPKVYHRIKVGHIVKFGGSSRLHILQGPEEDADEESEMSITEMKEQKEKQKREVELLRLNENQKEQERAEKERKMLEDKGCAWGMGEDAKEEGDENPFASLTSENENLYIDDPKKALKGFYEREGIDLPDYQFTESSAGSHKCTLEIPVDGPNGEELMAEAVVSGKKKDAVVACALEACRLLDKLGMLRSSTHEKRKRKQRNWEDNDYYDSDEDTFLDRTGTIEKKRTMRMKKAGKESAETYDSLMLKYNKVTGQIQEIEAKLEKAKADSEALANEEMDELEAYMVSIKSGVMDSKTRLQLKGELIRLKMDEQSLRRLVNIAKPATLPPLKPLASRSSGEKVSVTEKLSNKLQHLQQQKQLKKKLLPEKHTVMDMKPDEYEEDDEDEGQSGKAENKEIRLKEESQSHKSALERISPENLPSEKKDSTLNKSRTKIHSESLDDQTERPKSKKSSQYFSTSAALETMDQHRQSTKFSQAPQSQTQVNLDTLDPKFETWLPPKEQSGDGRTSLNDKFGY